jgi:hypothetical protein
MPPEQKKQIIVKLPPSVVRARAVRALMLQNIGKPDGIPSQSLGSWTEANQQAAADIVSEAAGKVNQENSPKT